MYTVKHVAGVAPQSSLRERCLGTTPSQAPVHPLPKAKTFFKSQKDRFDRRRRSSIPELT